MFEGAVETESLQSTVAGIPQSLEPTEIGQVMPIEQQSVELGGSAGGKESPEFFFAGSETINQLQQADVFHTRLPGYEIEIFEPNVHVYVAIAKLSKILTSR